MIITGEGEEGKASQENAPKTTQARGSKDVHTTPISAIPHRRLQEKRLKPKAPKPFPFNASC